MNKFNRQGEKRKTMKYRLLIILFLLPTLLFSQNDCRLAIGVDVVNETGFDANDGTAKANIWNNGYKDNTASITWFNGDTMDYITDLMPGTYSVSAVDTQGCYAESYFIIYPYVGCDYSDNVHSTDSSAMVDSFGALHPPINTTYMWSTGETTNSIDKLSTGIYSVTITNDGCSDVVTIGSTSINDIVKNDTYFYPNPATNNIWTNSDDITIFDMGGKMVKYSTNSIIDISDLYSGLYLIELDGEIKKMIIR